MSDVDWPKIAIVAVVFGIVLGGLGWAVNGRLQFGGYLADEDTDRAPNTCGIGGEDAFGGGQYPDLPSDGRRYGELASSQILWMSWFFDGQSSPVTFAGKLTACGEAGVGPPEGAYYKLSYSTDRSTWVGFAQDRNPSGSVCLDIDGSECGGLHVGGGFAGKTWTAPSYVYTIDGFAFKPCVYGSDTDGSPYYVSRSYLLCNPRGGNQTIVEGAVLRVEMFTFQKTQFEGEGFWRYFARDELTFLSALPKQLQWQTGACKVGATCVLNWETPTDKTEDGTPAYFLTIIDTNTNLAIDGYDRKALSGTRGAERIFVGDALFSNDLQTCQNRLVAKIYTQLVPVAHDEVAVQSDKEISLTGSPPVVSNIRFDKADYAEGDTVTVSWTVSGNVTKVHVTIVLNGIELYNADVNGTTRSVSTPAPFPGAGDAEITAYNYCTPGSVEEAHFVVGNVFPGLCTLFPDARECTVSGLGLLIAALAIFAVFVVFAVVLWVGGRLDLPPFAGLLLAFILAGVVAIAAVSAGLLDAVFHI